MRAEQAQSPIHSGPAPPFGLQVRADVNEAREETVAASQSYTVTIVGGGLGGLTTALALRRRGLQAIVVEQAPELGEVGAGIQTAPNASRILLGLGLRRQLEAIRTEPQDQVRRRWRDGSIIAQLPLGERVKREYNAPYWHYHRADLHRVLLDACLDPDGAGPVVEVHTDAQGRSTSTAPTPRGPSRSPRTGGGSRATCWSAPTASGRASATPWGCRTRWSSPARWPTGPSSPATRSRPTPRRGSWSTGSTPRSGTAPTGTWCTT